MSWFVLIAVVLVTVALLWLLPTLLRRHDSTKDVVQAAANVAIIKDQIAELERDLAAGTLSALQYQQAREELERRVLEETHDSAQTAPARTAGMRWTALALGIVVPLGAALLYFVLGTPGALSPQARTSKDHEVTQQEVEAMVARLAARLEAAPNDGDGWSLLGRSYMVMQRYRESAAAYARAAALVKDSADLFADYADALAMSEGGRINGKPLQLVEQALKIDATNWKALAMAGSAALERKDYRKAIGYWEKLQSRSDVDPEFARNIAASIEEARQAGGIKASTTGSAMASIPARAAANAKATPPPVAAAASVRGTVSMSRALAGRADPGDTVFIFARAPQGPRMPLAIVRRQVKDLPFTFSLDDSQAMAPGMKLSNFPEVVVGARVSKSGGALPQSGDLQGITQALKVGAGNVTVVIDTVVP